jgi:hypothetical protein
MHRLTTKEAALTLGVSRSRINGLIFSGEIVATKELITVGEQIGRWGKPLSIKHWVSMIEEAEITRYLETCRTARLAKLPRDIRPRLLDQHTKEEIADLAWLAGIVDGEGYLGLTQKRSMSKYETGAVWFGYTPTIAVAMNSEFVCQRALAITGLGQAFFKGLLHGKEHWVWRARNWDAALTLEMLLPFLIEKAYQAQLVIRGARINASYHSERKGTGRPTERTEELKALAHELFALHGNSHKHL